MRVGVLGINHKLATLHLRELLAKSCHRRLHPCQSTHGPHSYVLLSTCNRTEVYFSSENLAETHSYLLAILRQDIHEDFDQKLYSYFGQDCLLHLCRVTSGLDSAIVGETEIQGQVKSAYEIAKDYTKLPFEIHYLFQKSLSIAKKIRIELPLKPGLSDIPQAIYQTGRYFFKSKTPKILFIGASEINEKVLSYFKAKQLKNMFLCNRSSLSGQEMAKKHEIEFVEWNNSSSWPDYDWLILGTKAPGFLIEEDSFSSSNPQSKLIVDLSVPRNVNPKLACYPYITLLNIDQINRRLKSRKKNLLDSVYIAESLLLKTIRQQVALFEEKEKARLSLCAISA